MPIALNTPLLKARKEKRERGELLDEIKIEEMPETSSEVPEDPEEVTEKFEVGKTYKDKETGNVLTIEKRGTKRIYCYLNGEKESMYYRATIYAEKGTECVFLEDRDGNVLKFTAAKEEEETSVDFETTPVAAETLEEAKTMTRPEKKYELTYDDAMRYIKDCFAPVEKHHEHYKDERCANEVFAIMLNVSDKDMCKILKQLEPRIKEIFPDFDESSVLTDEQRMEYAKEARNTACWYMEVINGSNEQPLRRGYSEIADMWMDNWVNNHPDNMRYAPKKAEKDIEVREELRETSKEETAMTRTTMTVKELRAAAKAAGIKGYSRMTKADLEAALENHALTESIKAEYFRIEQKKLAEEVIDELRSAETSSEKKRILEEADNFTLEGIAIELGMTLPQMSDEDGLRERLIAVFVKPEATKTSGGIRENEILENSDEADENRRVSLEEYYEEKMRRDLNEFVKRLYGNDSEIEESADESKDAKTKAKKEAQTVSNSFICFI